MRSDSHAKDRSVSGSPR